MKEEEKKYSDRQMVEAATVAIIITAIVVILNCVFWVGTLPLQPAC